MIRGVAFDVPWLLVLVPLALLPWLRPVVSDLPFTSLRLIPRDPLSAAIGAALRVAGSLAIAAGVIALAGPHRPEVSVEKVGRGAEIVVMLDRSRSMDTQFIRKGAEGIYDGRLPTKAAVAREVLADFSRSRPDDLIAFQLFSTAPLPVLQFTQHNEMVQAAITAGGIGRGLGETDIGRALLSAAAQFEDRAYGGSRLIMLVSDGGARIDFDTRTRIAQTLRRLKISVYWIYLRGPHSRTLGSPGDEANEDLMPERFLHRFLSDSGFSYRSYEVENPESLRKAIADVSSLENLPIQYSERLPRIDWGPWWFALATVAALLVAAGRLMEVRRWPR